MVGSNDGNDIIKPKIVQIMMKTKSPKSGKPKQQQKLS